MTDQLFRHLTGPTGADRLNQLMWLGFLLSCVASLGLFSRFLSGGSTFRERALAFSLAWVAFYLMWSGSIVFAARITFNRLMSLSDETLLLFGDSSGTQFEVWNSDAHFYFLMAALPIFMVAAVISLGIHLVSRHIYTHASQNPSA